MKYLRDALKFSFLFLLFIGPVTAQEIAFIVNKKNTVNSMTTSQLVDFFMKKQRLWNDGEVVRFFDHHEGSPEREKFLKNYIKKNSREIELFWIEQKIYTGNLAPTQITSDTMMAIMVSKFPGAIGYVAPHFKLPAGVKHIKVTKD